MRDMNEMLTALRRFSTNIALLLTTKVDKVVGKQLTTEDFTSEEKAKLEAVKSMAMRDIHVSANQPDNEIGVDGDIWLVINQPE